MRFLFVGLGSIGQRHLRDAAALLEKMNLAARLFALRSSDAPLPGDISALLEKSFFSPSDLPDDFDAVFICNPTSLHKKTIKELSGKTRAMFIEKPIFSQPCGLSGLGLREDGVYYVACPLRFSPVLQYAKDYLRDKNVLRIMAECSSYLPDWRPGTDYRRTYSASSELGGGVRLDLIHEWDYLLWLFGEARDIKSVSGRVSRLEIDSEDYCCYSAAVGGVPLSLSLDYFGREARRYLTVLTDEGRVRFDILSNEVTASLNGDVMKRRFEATDIRYDEMEYFLGLITKPGTPNINTPENALASLEAALA